MVRDIRQGKTGPAAAHQFHGVVQHRQVPQAQEVHLQQAQLLQRGHGVLGDHRLVVFGQGDVLVDGPAGDDHSGGVGGGVAGHSLQGLGGVDEGVNARVPLIGVPQRLGEPQGLVQRDVERPRAAGDLLGHRVHIGIGHVHGPAHVPDGVAGGHGAEGDDLGHVVGAVLALDVLNDLLPAADAEIHIDVGHGDPLRIQEALEIQAVAYGVHLGDPQAVGHHTPRRRTPARAYRDVVALGVVDEVGDDQEVLHKAHLPDDAHLVLQPLPVALRRAGIAALKALVAELLKIGVPVGVALGELELGQVVLAELKFHAAPRRNAGGILHRFGPLGEERRHLLLRLDVKFLRLKAHPPRVVHRLSHLDAHEGVLHGRVLPGQIVGVIGDHQGDPGLPMEAQNPQ